MMRAFITFFQDAEVVLVPKKSRNVTICVDIMPLNRRILREIPPIPKVGDIHRTDSPTQSRLIATLNPTLN